MEIKLSAGDKIQVPAGCKAYIARNLIFIDEDFKEGDILRGRSMDFVVIFKCYNNIHKENFCSYYNNYNENNLNWQTINFRHATKKEKQAFFDNLKEKGLRWNAETKQMERIRKRAELYEYYLYISQNGEVLEAEEADVPFDDKNYESGNYYLPEERAQAEEDAKAIRAIFEKRLKVK